MRGGYGLPPLYVYMTLCLIKQKGKFYIQDVSVKVYVGPGDKFALILKIDIGFC
jgi:hypothetical protein